MDNLLKAIDVSSLEKARRCHRKGISRVADSFTPDEPHDSGQRRKVIGLGPESVIGLDRNTQEAEAAAARAVERARQAGEGTRAEGVAACFRAVRALLQASGA